MQVGESDQIAQIKSLFEYKIKDYAKLISLKMKLKFLLEKCPKAEKADDLVPLQVFQEADERMEEMDEIEEYKPVVHESEAGPVGDVDMESDVIESEEVKKDIIKFEDGPDE